MFFWLDMRGTAIGQCGLHPTYLWVDVRIISARLASWGLRFIYKYNFIGLLGCIERAVALISFSFPCLTLHS